MFTMVNTLNKKHIQSNQELKKIETKNSDKEMQFVLQLKKNDIYLSESYDLVASWSRLFNSWLNFMSSVHII